MAGTWRSWLFSTEKSRDSLRPWIKPSVCVVLLLSFAFVAYAAFSSGPYGWRCPLCAAAGDGPASTTALYSAAAAPIAAAAPTNVFHILFGIGGSTQTWQRRRRYSELWWRPGETRGRVWLDEEPAGGAAAWPATCPPYRVSQNASRYGHRASAARIARIAAEAYRGLVASGEERGVRWLVMGDDDTVFFPENLAAVLRKYDHEQMWYVGGTSESVEQDVLHSYGMAFGGGGFAISVPAAAELARVLDRCLDRYNSYYGSDQRIQACLSELGVPLTREPGFHQVDIHGDPYGMLAAHPVAPLVSLHHLDYVSPISPRGGGDRLEALGSLVRASRLDPARTLQQAICYDPARNWSVSVSWGYAAQVYPRVAVQHPADAARRVRAARRLLPGQRPRGGRRRQEGEGGERRGEEASRDRDGVRQVCAGEAGRCRRLRPARVRRRVEGREGAGLRAQDGPRRLEQGATSALLRDGDASVVVGGCLALGRARQEVPAGGDAFTAVGCGQRAST